MEYSTILHFLDWTNLCGSVIYFRPPVIHVAAGSPFCCVRRRPKFLGVFALCSVVAQIFGRFYAVLPFAFSKIGFLSVIGSPDLRDFSSSFDANAEKLALLLHIITLLQHKTVEGQGLVFVR